MKYRNHFEQRAHETGITEANVADVYDDIRYWCVEGYKKKVVEFVDVVLTDDERGSTLYRFQIPEGIFYALVDSRSGVPITCPSKDMVRKMKQIRVYKKKNNTPKSKKESVSIRRERRRK